MANIKGQMKRNITNEKRRARNASFKASLKTAIKAVEVAVENNNKQEANEALAGAFKKLDKAYSKGLFHKNYIARNKSRLAKLVNEVA